MGGHVLGTETVAQSPPQAFQHELVRFWEQLGYNGAAMSCAFKTLMAIGETLGAVTGGPGSGAKLVQGPRSPFFRSAVGVSVA